MQHVCYTMLYVAGPRFNLCSIQVLSRNQRFFCGRVPFRACTACLLHDATVGGDPVKRWFGSSRVSFKRRSLEMCEEVMCVTPAFRCLRKQGSRSRFIKLHIFCEFKDSDVRIRLCVMAHLIYRDVGSGDTVRGSFDSRFVHFNVCV